MRSLDRLEQQKRSRQQKKNQPSPDEETEEEMEYPKFIPLNLTKSAFDDDGRRFGGINTAPSVFQCKSVFRTEE